VTGNPTDGVLSEAWGHYKAHARHLLVISFAVYAGVAVLTVLLTSVGGTWGALIASVISIIGLFWVQGALVKAVEDIRDGRADLSIGDTFQRVRPKLVPIAIASTLAGIAIAIGMAAFILPGLLLMTWWSVIVPVIVLEDRGALDSFGRSRELVRGWGWQVFGVIVLTILLIIAFGILLGLLLVALPDEVRNFISNVVSGTLTSPFIALTWTLMYFRLKEAPRAAAGAV
jgi:hypothetical protein